MHYYYIIGYKYQIIINRGFYINLYFNLYSLLSLWIWKIRYEFILIQVIRILYDKMVAKYKHWQIEYIQHFIITIMVYSGYTGWPKKQYRKYV